MDLASLIDWKEFTKFSTKDFGFLALNLVLGSLLSAVLAWHYVRFGRTFGNRSKLAHVLVIMTIATVFIITLAKTSVGLAIGVLAAVSIVRFRTPVKEPEELAYLFLSIALGFGLGANEPFATALAFAIILAVLSVRSLWKRVGENENFYVTVELADQGRHADAVTQIRSALERHLKSAEPRRIDVTAQALTATFQVDVGDKAQVAKAVDELTRAWPSASVSFVEQRNQVGG